MNYSEMSDFEINKAVAAAFLSDWFENGLCVARIDGSTRIIFNPCNSWADAGPVIKQHEISLHYLGDGEWGARAFDRKTRWVNPNPLRAAMIVFLMMQEVK